MEVRPGYKRTEAGVIPNDWDAKAIGGGIDLLTGHPFPSTGYAESGVRLLRGSNVKRGQTDWNDNITQYWPSVTPDIARYHLRQGDLVIAMDGSLVGRSFAQLTSDDLPALLLQRVARIRSDKFDVTYLAAFVGSDRFVRYADSVKTVTAIPHISPGDIRNFTIPVPPTVQEQRAIAAVLSGVDALLGGLDRLIAKKRHLKQAAMQQLLTGQVRLPGFCSDWIKEPLRSFVRSHNSGVYKKSELYGQGCNIVGVSDIYGISCVHGQMFKQVPLSVAELTKHSLKTNDLLYGESSLVREGIAQTVYVTERGAGTAFAWHTRRYSIDQSTLISPFLYYYLQGRSARKHMMDQSIQTAITGINTVAYFGCPILVPPLAEQTAIATLLSDMDAELSALEARRNKTRNLKQAMVQELLTGKTRLVPNGGAHA
jgi:type I restriction enzyme S subunit